VFGAYLISLLQVVIEI